MCIPLPLFLDDTEEVFIFISLHIAAVQGIHIYIYTYIHIGSRSLLADIQLTSYAFPWLKHIAQEKRPANCWENIKGHLLSKHQDTDP